jgi:ribosomal protein S18 acetylase RimI-like enzyme
VTASPVLDDAVRHSLTGAHAEFALGGPPAWRYDPDVSVFGGVEGDGPEEWGALATLVGGHGIALFRVRPIEPPAGWTVPFRGTGYQLVLDHDAPVLDEPPAVDPPTGAAVTVRDLGAGDAAAMAELVSVAQPGPWRPRTVDLGGYVGVFHDDRLVAMAGQRFHPPGHCEVSAVATHPDARRRRYASYLTALVARRVQARGEVAFLHVASDNVTALPVYLGLGFQERAEATFALVVPPPAASN